jgi:cell division inhibitor SulA
MPKYVIERGIPGLGEMSEEDLRNISAKSCDVLRDLGGDVQWVQSYATDDKLFCVYIAPNAERVREHAHRGGFPADAVLQVNAIIDPTTAEAPVRAEA